MNFPLFIVKKIAFSAKKSFSRLIITIAICAVAISLSVMLIATSIVNGFQYEVSKKVYDFWSHIYVTPYSPGTNYAENPVYRYQDFYENTKDYPYISHVQSTAVKGGILYTDDYFEGILLKGIGADFNQEFFQTYIDSGRLIDVTNDTLQREIMISRKTAKRLGLHKGDDLLVSFMDKRIRMRKFTISAIYNTGIQEFDPKFAFVDIRMIQELNKWGPDTVGGFEIFVNDLAFLDDMADDIWVKSSDNNLRVETVEVKWRSIFDWLRLQNTNEVIILGLMCFVAICNMITALFILIVERSHMIGVLKSLGATNWTIQKIFLWNGLIIILSGLFLGNFLGLGILFLQKHFHFIKLPEETYYLSVAPVDINMVTIALINVSTLVLCWIFLLIPVILVGYILPVKVLRFK